MHVFACPACSDPLFFENLRCLCGAEVVYRFQQAVFATLTSPCTNRAAIGCNWEATGGDTGLCPSCDMTTVIPDSFRDENLALWGAAESSKRWVLANLARWGWFTDADTGARPTFHMLSEATPDGTIAVTMGHENGLVTINVVEADPVTRLSRGEDLGERLRTLTGHFRHEIAHFLFERLTETPDFLDQFRETFGDERADYGDALTRHYEQGPPDRWQEHYVSAYASCHPHEDWAESVAHLLHLTDIVDSFASAGLSSRSLLDGYAPYVDDDTERLVSMGVEIGVALNHVNRSMGLVDIYPFILTPEVRRKLALVHRWLRVLPGVATQARTSGQATACSTR